MKRKKLKRLIARIVRDELSRPRPNPVAQAIVKDMLTISRPPSFLGNDIRAEAKA